MSRRGYINISLLLVCIFLGYEAARVTRRPSADVAVATAAGPLAADSLSADRPSAGTGYATATDSLPVMADSLAEEVETGMSADEPAVRSTAPVELPVARISHADPAAMRDGHPFAAEARKVLSGGLEETDSLSRRRILDYCEHLRTSYTTRDIDFLRQVFSNDALIIVGSTVRTRRGDDKLTGGLTRYSVRSKEEYLTRLEKIFRANKKIEMKFSDFHISRHPSREGIYGVTLRQRYASDGYADDGYLFLLWDFRDQAMPLIHVRSWQEASDLDDPDDVIGLGDFNLR
ncbi:MAG: hypothetical protein HDS49_01765 [Bacteroides sp.]|nr:hypothetical protein [Bacteroides sp.]